MYPDYKNKYLQILEKDYQLRLYKEADEKAMKDVERRSGITKTFIEMITYVYDDFRRHVLPMMGNENSEYVFYEFEPGYPEELDGDTKVYSVKRTIGCREKKLDRFSDVEYDIFSKSVTEEDKEYLVDQIAFQHRMSSWFETRGWLLKKETCIISPNVKEIVEFLTRNTGE
jgi:hypothetical protein